MKDKKDESILRDFKILSQTAGSYSVDKICTDYQVIFQISFASYVSIVMFLSTLLLLIGCGLKREGVI